MKFREKLILANTEAAYGTPEALTGTHAILAKDVEINPLEGEELSRELDKPYLGADETILSGEHVSISFKVEMQASGAVAVAPGWGVLHRAAGFVETITALTNVVYDLAGSDYESATIHFYMGVNLHAMTGTRGSVKIIIEKGIPYFEYNFIGLHVDPSQVVTPTPDWSKFIKPFATGPGTTSGFTLNGYAANPYALTLDVGQSVKYIQTLQSETVDINDREASGSVRIEAPEIGTKDYFADIKNRVTGALSIQHGQTAGSICKIDCPKVQAKNPKYGDYEGNTSLDMDLVLIPTSAGNDEVKITLT